MLAGLAYAQGDVVVIMDADLQHPPRLLVEMLDLHRQGYDQVVARRTRDGDAPLPGSGLVGQSPVDGRAALLHEQLVDAAERLRAEEAARRRQRARVRRLHGRDAAEEGRQQICRWFYDCPRELHAAMDRDVQALVEELYGRAIESAGYDRPR